MGDIESRFWPKVDKDGPVPDHSPGLGPCWIWTAATTAFGYGYFRLRDKHRGAHRVAYEILVGPIPEGLQLDHLCRVRNCVNPAHLEPVTGRVNTLRGNTVAARHASKTHCPQGHPYSGENLSINQRGERQCRKCHREVVQRSRSKERVSDGIH